MHFEQGGATGNHLEGPPSQPQTQPDRLVPKRAGSAGM